MVTRSTRLRNLYLDRGMIQERDLGTRRLIGDCIMLLNNLLRGKRLKLLCDGQLLHRKRPNESESRAPHILRHEFRFVKGLEPSYTRGTLVKRFD